MPGKWGRIGAGKRCATTWKGENVSDKTNIEDAEKLIAAIAEKTGKRKASAAKMLMHKGAIRKRAASMKVKR